MDARSHLLFGGHLGGQPETTTHSTLTAVSSEGFPEVVEVLLDHGAPIQSTGMFGETALHTAAWYGHSEIVALLLDRGAEPEPLDDEYGATPLFWAIHGAGSTAWCGMRDQVGAARRLLAAGKLPDARSIQAFHDQFRPFDPDMEELLVELGVRFDPDTTDDP